MAIRGIVSTADLKLKTEITEKVGKSLQLYNSMLNSFHENTDLKVDKLQNAYNTAMDEDS